MNPNNRRVVAMILWGQIADQRQELKSSKNSEARTPERLVVLSMDVVRYMTQVSGFLYINSDKSKGYMDFDRTHFSTPKKGWRAPYPYCPDDVLFAVEKRNVDVENQILEPLLQSPFVAVPKEQLLWEELLANDSLGGWQ